MAPTTDPTLGYASQVRLRVPASARSRRGLLFLLGRHFPVWVTLITFRGDRIAKVLVLEDTSAIAAAYQAASGS